MIVNVTDTEAFIEEALLITLSCALELAPGSLYGWIVSLFLPTHSWSHARLSLTPFPLPYVDGAIDGGSEQSRSSSLSPSGIYAS